MIPYTQVEIRGGYSIRYFSGRILEMMTGGRDIVAEALTGWGHGAGIDACRWECLSEERDRKACYVRDRADLTQSMD